MLSVKGTYENGRLVFDENINIKKPVKVIVTFLEEIPSPSMSKIDFNKFSFKKSQEILKDYKENISCTVIEERRTSR